MGIWTKLEAHLGLLVPALATVAAAVSAPICTLIYQHEKVNVERVQVDIEREKAGLEQAKHLHATKMEYLRAAIDPASDAETRRRILRYLELALKGDPLQAWASEELKVAEKQLEEVAGLRRELEAARIELAAAEAAKQRASAGLHAAENAGRGKQLELESALAKARERYEAAERKQLELEAKREDSSAKGGAPFKLVPLGSPRECRITQGAEGNLQVRTTTVYATNLVEAQRKCKAQCDSTTKYCDVAVD